MNEGVLAIGIVVAAMIVVPIIYKVIVKAVQDADYKRQVEGKIPTRTFKGNVESADTTGTAESIDAFKESCDAELRMRGMQNIIGPK